MSTILALNGGSATVKAALFSYNNTELQCIEKWNLARQGDDTGLSALATSLQTAPTLVTHRIVHGGDYFSTATPLTPQVVDTLQTLVPLAPLHQPFNLDMVIAALRQWPTAQHIGCFDTAFHQTQDDLVRRYALPRTLHDRGIKRYGFHGLSYAHITRTLLDAQPSLHAQRMIVLHLGNGASACAIHEGKSIATSMGFSPLDGLVMSSRCGQLDPGVLLHLLREGMDVHALETLLYKQSGLLGVSGSDSNLQVLLEEDSASAREAVALFAQKAAEVVAQLATQLQGVDRLVFTGGIGEHQARTRALIVARLAWLGAALDDAANARHDHDITHHSSRIQINVMQTDEELEMVRQALTVIDSH